ncbi:MAG: class I SAM-dependent methyltransferase [Caldilineaceae bacterium]
MSPHGRIVNLLGEQVPTLVARFADGEGIPYDAYRPGFTHSLDDIWRRVYDEQLIDGFLGKFPALTAAMDQGIRVLDIGCGTGHALNVLAAAFPRSTFVGYDLADDGIALAQAEAEEMGLDNVSFAVMDVTHFSTSPPYDLIMAFDTVHDLSAPDAVLNRIREALAPNGAFLMVDSSSAACSRRTSAIRSRPCTTASACCTARRFRSIPVGQGLEAVWE